MKQNLEAKANRRDIQEDVDYVNQEQEDDSVTDVENLNLFGVPMPSDDLGTSTKDKSDKRRFVQELLEVMDALDPDNTLTDFEKPKTFIQFDPYVDTPDGLGAQSAIEQAAMSLRYEDNMKLRASLVLEAYQAQLNHIEPESLSYEDKERYHRVNNLLIYLKTVKVIDAPVLLKIYNMFRCSL